MALCLGLVLSSALGGTAAGGATGGALPRDGVVIFSDSFANSTVSSSVGLPPSSAGGNTACLTASNSTTQTPVPGCAGSNPIDPNGSGALRLTGASSDEAGGLFSGATFPSSEGIDVTFDTYQYGGSEGHSNGDGIAFDLAAVDPSNPSLPATFGSDGGALGYAPNGTTDDGLGDGYLGFGLDVGGNFTNSSSDGSSCSDPGWGRGDWPLPENVTVRGPGNGTTGYCLLDSTATPYDSHDSHDATRFRLDTPAATTRSAATAVPVEVVLNPTASTVTTPSGLSVTSGHWAIEVDTIGSGEVVLRGCLPTVANGELPAGLYPSSWLGTSGAPQELALGWTGSTGMLTEIHELTSATATTLTKSEVPVLQVNNINEYASAASGKNDLETWDFPVVMATGSAEEHKQITADITLPTGTNVLAAGGASDESSASAPNSFWTCGNETSTFTLSCTTSGGPYTSVHGPPPLYVTGEFAVPQSATARAVRPAVTPLNAQIIVSSPDAVGAKGRGSIHDKPPPAPSDLKVAPPTGPTTGGNQIKITGDHLAHTTAVTLGHHVVQACPAAAGQPCYKMSAGSVVLFHVPAGGPGMVRVVVTTLGVSGSSAYQYKEGFWVVARDGGVFSFGTAAFHGSLGSTDQPSPIVGMAALPFQRGYWLVEADGAVKPFGAAVQHGGVARSSLSGHIVGIASTPDGGGYWLVSSSGVVYPFGDATALGSVGRGKLSGHIVSITATRAGDGYWLLSSTGAVYHFGNAKSFGGVSSGVRGTVVGFAALPSGKGYWIASSTGQVWHRGAAPAIGPGPGATFPSSIIGIASSPDGRGIWLLFASGLSTQGYGDALPLPVETHGALRAPVVGICTI